MTYKRMAREGNTIGNYGEYSISSSGPNIMAQHVLSKEDGEGSVVML